MTDATAAQDGLDLDALTHSLQSIVASNAVRADIRNTIRETITAIAALRARAERAEAAIGLIWSLHVREHVHLGFERASGIEQGCIPCICACALGQSMDGDGGYTAADYIKAREDLKAGDAAIRARTQGGDDAER